MKKIKLLVVIYLTIFLLCGCSIGKNSLENATIYTTVYPVEFITNYLYGDSSTVKSIYPYGININDYNLTEKQIAEYSKGDLFVYIGLGSEKNIAKSLRNSNDDLLVIDATYGLNYNNNIEELWLAPNNFLMLAKNIKTSLNEYLDNTLISENIEEKYNDLYTKVSWVDAELRNVAKEAKENDNVTLVVSSNVFKYLENYGFDIISLEDIEGANSETILQDLKNKFKNSKYSSIIKLKSETNTDLINELIDKNKATLIEINDLITNNDPVADYVSLQYENITLIRNLLIK